MSITIRRAVAEDLDAVRHIGLSTWPPTYGPLKGARYVDEALETYWSVEALQTAIDAGTIDLAETAQGVVGMAEVADLGEDMVMWKLYILPSQQRSGLGHALISAAKERARARGRDLLTEYVPENSNAGSFYEREGFVPTTPPWPGTDAVWVRWQCAPAVMISLNRVSSTRSDRGKQLGRVLAELSDADVATLLAGGEPLGTGIGGSTARVHLEGEPLFVKQMPLTSMEKTDVHSTAHRVDLPMACHYGIGSPGFGVGRELAAHELTSRWVYDGEVDFFPLLVHARALDRPCRTDTSEFEGSAPRQQWGTGWPRVARRVDALRGAGSSMALFLEYLPETLGAWLRRQFTAGAHTGGAAFAEALAQIVTATTWMRAHGLRHLDVHPGNILVDRGRLLFTDFGLSMHESFDLDQEERAFFDLHDGYDHDTGVTSLLHWTLAELGADDHDQRTTLLKSAARHGVAEELERLCTPLEAAAHLVAEHAQTAAMITDMFDLLLADATATSYDMITTDRRHEAKLSGS